MYSLLVQFSVFFFLVEVLSVCYFTVWCSILLPSVVLLSVRYHFVSIVYIPELILILFSSN